jgi:DNA-binding response OmpR family regulator
MNEILIVDRNPSSVDSLVVALRHAGFSVTAMSEIERVLEISAQENPRLVLMDTFPSDMRGVTIREKLRHGAHAGNSKTPIVLLLVDISDEERIYSLLGGSFDYITRPFDPVEVVAFVKSLLPARSACKCRCEPAYRAARVTSG